MRKRLQANEKSAFFEAPQPLWCKGGPSLKMRPDNICLKLCAGCKSIGGCALSNKPEYLRNKQTDNNLVIDYRDWQIPLSRRFRSLATTCAVFNYGANNSFHGVSLHFWRRGFGTWRIVVNYVLHADLWSCGWCCVSMESQACNHTFENIVNSASILKDLCNLIQDLRFSHYDTDGLLHN